MNAQKIKNGKYQISSEQYRHLVTSYTATYTHTIIHNGPKTKDMTYLRDKTFNIFYMQELFRL